MTLDDVIPLDPSRQDTVTVTVYPTVTNPADPDQQALAVLAGHVYAVEVDVIRCVDDDTNEDYEYFDAICNGECINFGEPWFDLPTYRELAETLAHHLGLDQPQETLR